MTMIAASSTLLESSVLKRNPPVLYMQRCHRPCALFYSNHQRKSKFGRLQITVKYKQSDADSNWKNSFEKMTTQIKRALDSVKKPAIAAVLLGLLLFYNRSVALAASGGRVGGPRNQQRELLECFFWRRVAQTDKLESNLILSGYSSTQTTSYIPILVCTPSFPSLSSL